MLKRRTATCSLCPAADAVAALEFALIAPLAGIMLLATFNISKAIVIWEEVQNTAHLISVSATTVSQPKDPKNPRQAWITDAAVQQSLSIIYAQMPWLANGAEKGRRSVTLTSIGFYPASAAQNCQVTASQNCNLPYVAFSAAYSGGSLPGAVYFDTTVMRSCGSLYSLSSQIAPTAPIPPKQTWLTTLRTATVAQPDAIMVADVHYTFTPYLPPLIANIFPATFDFYATNMWPARIGLFNVPPGQQYTQLDGSSGTGACPAPPASNS